MVMYLCQIVCRLLELKFFWYTIHTKWEVRIPSMSKRSECHLIFKTILECISVSWMLTAINQRSTFLMT
jgi:hypothetical protein